MSRFALLTEKELSQETGISCNTFRYWRANGQGPPFMKLGKSVRYRADEVERWMAENTVDTREEA